MLDRVLGAKKVFNVLLVDDTVEDLILLEKVLDSPELCLTKATSGTEALELLVDHDFDLILLDVFMPEMGGFEAASIIRDQERTRNIPIIFVTATGRTRENVFEGYELGGVDYIFKPIEPDLLRGKVHVFCEFRRKDAVIRDQLKEIQRQKQELEEKVAEREQAEGEVWESEERYRLLAENATDVIWTMDMNLNPTFISPSVTRMRGHSVQEAMTLRIEDFMVPKSVEASLKMYAEELVIEGQEEKDLSRSRTIEAEMLRKDGSTLWTEINMRFIRDQNNSAIGILGITRDITERKRAEEDRARLEEQLRQAQKMESLGTMAGGFAHEFNNILGAIMGYTEMALLDSQENLRLRSNLEHVMCGGGRARDLINKVLEFSRRENEERKAVDILPIVEETLDLIGESLPTTIELHKSLLLASGIVMAARTQIEAILNNLCENASQAMHEKGGVLEVSLAEADLAPDDMGAYPNLTPGPYLRLTVSDTGCGMEKALLGRVFDPFFTSRQPGEGTGMGLAIVHGILKVHGGAISASSEPGKGSVFSVMLPREEQEAASAADSRPSIPVTIRSVSS